MPLENGDGEKYITILQVADEAENAIIQKDIFCGDKYGLMGMFVKENYLTMVFG